MKNIKACKYLVRNDSNIRIIDLVTHRIKDKNSEKVGIVTEKLIGSYYCETKREKEKQAYAY